MTNFEYWKDRILEITEKGSIAIVGGKPVESKCFGVDCSKCDFFDNKGIGSCLNKLIKWLYSEHVKTTKLTKRERKLCEALGTGWIAADKSGRVFWYSAIPYKAFTVYYTNGASMCISDAGFYFEFMDFEDEDPWMVENLLRLEVEE